MHFCLISNNAGLEPPLGLRAAIGLAPAILSDRGVGGNQAGWCRASMGISSGDGRQSATHPGLREKYIGLRSGADNERAPRIQVVCNSAFILFRQKNVEIIAVV